MTVEIAGHVGSTEMGPIGMTAVKICAESSKCPEPFVVFVPRETAKMYSPGTCVRVLIHPLPEPPK